VAGSGIVGETYLRPTNWLSGVLSDSINATSAQLIVDAINVDLVPHGLLARLVEGDFIEIVSATEFFYDANDYDGYPIGVYFTPIGLAPLDSDATPP
jgi:hypothetical protein